jgi:hypothetical protein
VFETLGILPSFWASLSGSITSLRCAAAGSTGSPCAGAPEAAGVGVVMLCATMHCKKICFEVRISV